MRVIGIDPGFRKIGIATRDVSNGLATGVIANNCGDYSIGIRQAAETLSEWLSDYRPNLAAIEGMAFGKFGVSDSIMKLAEMTGAIKFVIATYELPLVIIPTGQWRSVTGKQLWRLPKATQKDRQHYLDIVQVMHGLSFSSTDEADAYMIMRAIELVDKGQEKNKSIEEKLRAATGRLAYELF